MSPCSRPTSLNRRGTPEVKTLTEAMDWLLAQSGPPPQAQRIPIASALGRILAETIRSPLAVPAFDNAQMDGFAVRSGEIQSGTVLPVSQRIPAGAVAEPLLPQTAARVFTGAPMPAGADAVVMQEDTEILADGQVRFHQSTDVGQFVRFAGGDLQVGQVVLPAGRRLSAADVGLLASIGMAELSVYRTLRVGVFSSGNELRQPGEPLGEGQIYDSNRPMIMSLVRGMGLTVDDLGSLPDCFETTRRRMSEGGQQCDVLLTCGGVSVGEEDHIKSAVTAEGTLDLWKIAIKPGKPFAFGRVGRAAFLGMPGNPVSAWVTFVLLVRPFLLKASGQADVSPRTVWVPAGFDKPTTDARQEFLRASIDPSGHAVLHARQNSQILSSISESEGLLEVPMNAPVVRGDRLRFFPFSMLLA
ncbi:MAG: gephyrin-like molybdotransferase Glp [Burkholderiaceae bacterium]